MARPRAKGWLAGLAAAGLCLGAGALAGRDTVASMDPWYRDRPLVRMAPAPLPTFAPAAAVASMPVAAPIRAAGWAEPPAPLELPDLPDLDPEPVGVAIPPEPIAEPPILDPPTPADPADPDPPAAAPAEGPTW